MEDRLEQKTDERKTHYEYVGNRSQSVDAPTVGSTQERAHQQQVHTFGVQNKYKVSENADSFMREVDEKDANAIGIRDLQIYDSLEVNPYLYSRISSTQVHVDATENKPGIKGESKMVSENVYSELCYDPNMMPNLSGAGSLSPKMTTGGYYIVPKGRESHIGHIAGTDSVLLVPSHMSAAKCDQLYRHHPQDGRTGSSSTSNDNVARRSAESHDPRTSGVLNDTQSTVTSQTGLRRHSECDVHPKDGDPCSERGDSEPESNVHQQPGVAASKKLERQEDIVERNKITLGRNTFPGGSYRMAYAHKQSRAHNGNKVPQICKEKKGQRIESPKLPLQGVTAEQGDGLNPPSERPAAASQPRKTSLPPNCHPGIGKPAHLLPLVEPRAQDAVVNRSDPDCTYLGPAPVAEWTPLPGYQEVDHEKLSPMSQQGTVGRVYQVNRVTSPVHGCRIAAKTRALPGEGDEHKWIPDEFQSRPSPQRLPRSPTSPASASLSLGSDTYSVLPPVGRLAAGEELELSPGQSANTADSIHRSSSDSYLAQMGKQKQLGATYKTYSLKDYNQLQLNVTLRGLGPDYKAVEEAAEKMRRQRLYSNVIREQNKKISRIPFLPAKNLQGTDKKVPRIKALEYAKTITKPCAQPQAKQRQQGHWKDCEQQTPPPKGLHSFPPDTLAALLKRHEEEKKAAAQRVHAVSG